MPLPPFTPPPLPKTIVLLTPFPIKDKYQETKYFKTFILSLPEFDVRPVDKSTLFLLLFLYSGEMLVSRTES